MKSDTDISPAHIRVYGKDVVGSRRHQRDVMRVLVQEGDTDDDANKHEVYLAGENKH